MLIARSLPVSPFFLVPIGIVAMVGGAFPLAVSVVLTVAINFIVVLASAGPLTGELATALFSDSAYFLVLVASFAWAAYSAEAPKWRFMERKSSRFVASAVTSAIVLFPIILIARRDQAIVDFYNVQAKAISDAFRAAAGADVVQQSLIEREITPERVSRTITLIVSRGAVVGHLIFFGVSWRMAQMIASFRIPGLRLRHPFVRFRNGPNLVWGLIASLLAVMATKFVSNTIFEVTAWNGMLLCVLLYIVQGMAVLSYNLARPGVPRFLRFLVVLTGTLVIFRPGINAVAGIALAVVGVAENWLPLRAPINTEPPSTPEA